MGTITDVAASVWERIFDFGDGQMGPYLFLTRGMRGRVSILTGSWWRTDESARPPVAPTSCWANGGKLWRTVAVTQTIILEDPSLRQMMISGAQWRIAAVLSCGEAVRKKEFAATILPEQVPAYELTIHPQETESRVPGA